MIELPSKSARDYLAAFKIAVIYILTVREGIVIGAGRSMLQNSPVTDHTAGAD